MQMQASSGRRGPGGLSVLLAPDAFKTTFAAAEVAAALARGVSAAGAVARPLPVADGGEGTAAALVAALGGEWRSQPVHDPLGRAIEARWGLLADGRAIVEAAAASGLELLAPDELDAWAASTRGTGELIAAAAAAGARRVLVAAGGSATTDGGAGAVEALDGTRRELAIDVLCDVQTPWEQAAATFAPQKGADPPTVERLARRLEAIAEDAPRDPRGVAMTGCAGGLSGGLWAFRNARLLPGAPFVLDALSFDSVLAEVDLVLTGEGRLDPQTRAGKAVAEVARRARGAGVRCCAIVGQDAGGDGSAAALGLDRVVEATSLDQIAARAEELVGSQIRR